MSCSENHHLETSQDSSIALGQATLLTPAGERIEETGGGEE